MLNNPDTYNGMLEGMIRDEVHENLVYIDPVSVQ